MLIRQRYRMTWVCDMVLDELFLNVSTVKDCDSMRRDHIVLYEDSEGRRGGTPVIGPGPPCYR